jgi:hypothetical protein
VIDCTKCKGHKRYIGGSMDGHVAHLVYATPSDYPQTYGTMLRDDTRSWYELDYDASDGTEAVYRFIGMGRDFPGPAESGRQEQPGGGEQR